MAGILTLYSLGIFNHEKVNLLTVNKCGQSTSKETRD